MNPRRLCRNSTGPGESSFIIRAVSVSKGNSTTRYPATPKARWEIDGAGFRVVYDPDGRGKQVYLRGRIDNWTKNNTGAFFELLLREVIRWPVKEGDVLILER